MFMYLGLSSKGAVMIIREESLTILLSFDVLMVVGEVVSSQGEAPSLRN